MQPVYIEYTASIHPQGKNPALPYLTACEPDYKSVITNATLRRRMSRIIKMGVACGLECIADLPSEQVQGIITATGLGCLTDTEKFMNALIDNEERMLNPTPFIQSTFNTIGGQIALLRGIHAYNMTYVHRGLSFESALLDAIINIWEGKDHILVGAIDEITETSYAVQKRLGLLRGSQNVESHGIRESIEAGEGAQFFLLSREPSAQTLAEIVGIETFTGKHSTEEVSQRITAFLQKNGTEMRDICRIVTGKTGNDDQDIVYHEIESQLFPQAIGQTFKNECGEYPTASAYALWKVAQSPKNGIDSETVLIYNHHHSIHHSLMLIRKNI